MVDNKDRTEKTGTIDVIDEDIMELVDAPFPIFIQSVGKKDSLKKSIEDEESIEKYNEKT
jgi:hypothetical protein